MIFLLDNYDSFTYNLRDYLMQLGQEVVVRRNDEITADEVLNMKPKGIVISPGPGRPENAGITMELIEKAYPSIPMLGICLGHQALGVFFGADLIYAHTPMHGKLSRLVDLHPTIFDGLVNGIEVCRYHSLVLSNTAQKEIEVAAVSVDNEIMAIRHKQLPIWGVQYHPEAILTQGGKTVLENWLKLFTLRSVKR